MRKLIAGNFWVLFMGLLGIVFTIMNRPDTGVALLALAFIEWERQVMLERYEAEKTTSDLLHHQLRDITQQYYDIQDENIKLHGLARELHGELKQLEKDYTSLIGQMADVREEADGYKEQLARRN